MQGNFAPSAGMRFLMLVGVHHQQNSPATNRPKNKIKNHKQHKGPGPRPPMPPRIDPSVASRDSTRLNKQIPLQPEWNAVLGLTM